MPLILSCGSALFAATTMYGPDDVQNSEVHSAATAVPTRWVGRIPSFWNMRPSQIPISACSAFLKALSCNGQDTECDLR